MLVAGDDLRHDDALELASHFFNPFNFNSKHGQSLGQFLRRPIELHVLPEPVESDFHLELPQKPHIILIKQPNVIYAISNHRNALDAEAERPSGPHLGVVANVLENLRVHHAAPGNFQPLLAHSASQCAAEINLEAWFSIAEIVRAKSNARLGSHQLLEYEFNRAF